MMNSYSISKKAVFLIILFEIIFTNLFLIFNLLFLSQIFSTIYLLLIPGLLLLLILDIKTNIQISFLLIIGLSIGFIILFGLGVNSFFSLFHLKNPLTFFPLMVSFDLIYLALYIIAYIKTSFFQKSIPILKSNLIEKFLSITATFSMILGVLGVIQLNNHSNNYLILFSIGLICLIALFTILLNSKISHGTQIYLIWIISFTSLSLWGLRSYHVSGGDIGTEFYLFESTKKLGYWSTAIYNNAYNSCLSITILPTILSNFIHIPDEYIFKIFFNFLFSMTAVITYIIIKRTKYKKSAFIGAFFFIAQNPFIIWMPMLARQEIGLFFFALILLSQFDELILEYKRKILFIIFGFSIIVSHYSVAYLTIFLFLFTYVIFFIYRKAFLKEGITYFLNLRLILILLLFSFLWLSQITKTSNNLSTFISNTFLSIVNINKESLKSTSVENSISFNFFNNLFSTTNKDLKKYSEDVIYKYKKIDIQYYKNFSINDYVLKPSNSVLLPVINFQVFLGINLMTKLSSSLFKASFFIAFIYLLLQGLKKKIIYNENIILGFASVILLALIIAVPFISLEYNFERLLQQTLFFLVIFLIIGMNLILRIFKYNPVKKFIFAVTVILYYSYNVGLTNQLVGGEPSPIFNNFGKVYDQDYTLTGEVYAANWLNQFREKNAYVYVDSASQRKLTAYGSLTINKTFTDLYPPIIDKRAYIFLSFANVHDNLAYQLYSGKDITYDLKKTFFQKNKNLIYSNAISQIYK